MRKHLIFLQLVDVIRYKCRAVVFILGAFFVRMLTTKNALTARMMNDNTSQTRMAPALGQRASSGFFWLFAQSGLLKVVGFVRQIVLAWLLTKEDFGAYALAALVAMTVRLLHQGGLCGVLISRGDHLKRWISPAFWLSSTTGVLASATMLGIAPLAARMFHDSKLTGLICVFSVWPLISGVLLVPQAIMQVSMRFRALSVIAFVSGVLSTLFTITLARLGCHAYSIIIPAIAGEAGTAATFWWLTRPRIKPRPQFRRWRLLIVDAGYSQGVAAMLLILGQADYFTLGRLRSVGVVGLYFFAFNLAMQPVVLMTASLGGILLPVLTRLRSESARQAKAFVRVTRQLVLVGAPMCIAQALLGRSLLKIVFHGRWNDAIPAFQVLSIGAAFSLLGPPANALLEARRQFRTYFIFTALSALTFIATVQIGARLGGAVSMAIAVTFFYFVFGPLGAYVAVTPAGGRLKDVLRIYFVPMVAGVAAFGGPWLLINRFLLGVNGADWVLLIATPLIGVPAYIILIRAWARSDWVELVARIRQLKIQTQREPTA